MKLAISLGVAVAALFLAGSAQAQTTTNCQNSIYGQPQFGVTCKTAEAPRAEDVPAKRCTFYDHLALDEQTCAARAAAAARANDRKAVTDQLAAGNCDQAVKTALALGNLQYAREVRDFCSK